MNENNIGFVMVAQRGDLSIYLTRCWAAAIEGGGPAVTLHMAKAFCLARLLCLFHKKNRNITGDHDESHIDGH